MGPEGPPPARDGPLGEVARLFLKLGCLGFGGPAAHIALMEEETVGRRGWLTRQDFVDLIGAANLIPGPNSTELAIHLGLRRAGPRGLVVAGLCFIAPAALITLAFGWAYVRFGTLPAAESLLYGIKPAILAIVVAAVARLTRTALNRVSLLAIGLAAAGDNLLGIDELLILLAGGATAMLLAWPTRPAGAGFVLLGVPTGVAVSSSVAAPSLTSLGCFFSRSEAYCTAAATCCWPSFAAAWWPIGTG